MPFGTFCLPLKKIQKVQNSTLCLHFVGTKDKQKAQFCHRQKKTKFSLSSMHKRWSKTVIWKNGKVKTAVKRSYVVSRNTKKSTFFDHVEMYNNPNLEFWMQHVNPDTLLHNFCDQRLSFESKMKQKAIKVQGKMTFYFTKDWLSVMTDNKIQSK